ncbi:MAG TPA: IS110 family transposase [Terriglobales bacterium]|nr:IS110 family transposase [Terriglobales bacterium]
MLIIGCDFHPSGQQVFGVDEATGEVFADQWLDHKGKAVEEFYSSLPAGAEVGVESTGNLLWFERVLARHGHRLRIGDALKIQKQETRKQKHDRRAAELIARLMYERRFPELRWVPSLAERDQRQLLMHRHKLVRMRTQIKNQLQHIALNQGIQKKYQLWTKQGRELLENLVLEPWTARRRDELLELLDTLEGYCASLELAVKQAAESHAEARRLMTHPGVGPVISLAFVLTLGDINRFQRSREVVSYLGLNPSEESSGERRRLGAISKQGSGFMRWLLIQGAQTTVRGDAELGRQYRRLAVRKSRSIAKVMVARKLAVRMFWMLKTQTEYPEVVRMQGSSSHPLGKAPSACVSTLPPHRIA